MKNSDNVKKHTGKTENAVDTGLRDTIACNSEISFIDGEKGFLVYRGYEISDLAKKSNFEETAYLLWYGRLPGRREYDFFNDSFTGSLELPIETVMILRMFPKSVTPMEVLRTTVSSLGHWDPDSGHMGLDAALRKSIRLTAAIPILITAHERLRQGSEPIHPQPGKSIAYNFLYTLLNREPPEDHVKALDVALMLHADHTLNASTFAARITASTRANLFSAVTAAIGALSGPLHGGANENVMKMLDEIKTPDKAESWVLEKLKAKIRIPGFGHRVYRVEDPRATIFRKYAHDLSVKAGNSVLFDTAEAVREIMLKKSKVFPNVDFYSGICYRMMNIPNSLFTPVFACSRIVGWTAHIMEQWADSSIIRPRANYAGHPLRKYVSIEKRD